MYLLRSKDKAIEAFIQYKNEVENQLNKKIKVLRSDRGGEYESPFGEFCLPRFSDLDRSLNHKRKSFKVFEVELGSNRDDVIIIIIN